MIFKDIRNIPLSQITAIFLFFTALLLFFIDHRWTDGKIIEWDMWSYYAYLPVTFLEQDWSMSFMNDHPEYVQNRYWPVQAPNGNWVIKTSMGMAIIYLPYFIIAHLWALVHSGMDANGFSEPYQIMIGLSGSVSLFIGLLNLRNFLKSYFSETVIAFTFIFIVFGTNALHYTYNEGAMSHIHNFMLFSIFMRLTQLWHENPNWKYTILISLLSGLIALVRPNNALIGLFFIFYNVYNIESIKTKFKLFWNSRFKLVILPFLALSVWIPQLLYWKYTSGSWFFHSYIGERFFFDRPRFTLALFSYTKGWFVYTPLAIIGLIGLFLIPKKSEALKYVAPFFILFNMYVVFSWWCWWYGGGYSQRALIDSYPVLAIGFASFFTLLFNGKILKFVFTVPLLLLLSLSLFQTWQYSIKLIHWDATTKELYWTVFLKTKHPANYETMLRSVNMDDAKRGKVKYWGDK